jgi:hypothetical protein
MCLRSQHFSNDLGQLGDLRGFAQKTKMRNPNFVISRRPRLAGDAEKPCGSSLPSVVLPEEDPDILVILLEHKVPPIHPRECAGGPSGRRILGKADLRHKLQIRVEHFIKNNLARP